MSLAAPYRSTPVFNNETLPAALRRPHSTKAGVWARLKVLQGSILFTVEDSGERQVVRAPGAVTIVPLQLHSVEPLERMEMQVDFYDQAPDAVTGHSYATHCIAVPYGTAPKDDLAIDALTT